MIGGGCRTAPPPVKNPPPIMSTSLPEIQAGALNFVIEMLGSTERSANKGVRVVAHCAIDVNDTFHCTTLAVVLTPHPTYRLHASIAPSRHELLPITAVVDSGAGLNVVSREVVDRLEWSMIALDVGIPRLCGANDGHLLILGDIIIYVRLSFLTVRSYLAVAESLPFPLILGTEFIDKHIRATIPRERRIVPRDSPPVAMLSKSTGSRSVGSIDIDDVPRRVSTDEIDKSVRVVRQVTLTPRKKSLVIVRANLPGIIDLTFDDDAATSIKSLPASGVVDIFSGAPF